MRDNVPCLIAFLYMLSPLARPGSESIWVGSEAGRAHDHPGGNPPLVEGGVRGPCVPKLGFGRGFRPWVFALVSASCRESQMITES
jgi:hypothetical protein